MKKIVLSLLSCVAGAALLFCGMSAGEIKPLSAEAAATPEEYVKESKIAYISTLGELLDYTYDYYVDTDKLNSRFAEEYTLILTRDLDLATDTTWHEYAPDWETRGWPVRDIFADIEGGGYTISNLWCKPLDDDGGERFGGLFGFLKGNVSNLNIVWDQTKTMPSQSNIWDYYGNYGGLACEANDVKVSNVHVKAKFVAASSGGGIVDWPINVEIDNCSFEGEIDAITAGGIVQYAHNSTSVTNCLFKGKLSGFGLGGIAARLHLAPEPPEVRYSSNVAIIEDLKFIDLGIYNKRYYPVGAFIGFFTYPTLQPFTFTDNFFYVNPAVTDEVREISAQVSDDGQVHLGGPTEDYSPGDSALAKVTDTSDKNLFSGPNAEDGLDFEKYWIMDAEKGHPVTKRNFVSIINLTAPELTENYIIGTEQRYYLPNETASVKSRIRDKSDCQLICYTLDGVDALKSIGNSNVTLVMTSSHVIVTKAAPLTEMVLEGLGNAESLLVNGEAVEPSEGVYRFKYRLGDKISVSVGAKSNFNVSGFKLPDGYAFVEEDGYYSFVIPVESNLDVPVSLNAVLEGTFTNPTLEPDSNKASIIAASVCVGLAVAIAAGAVIGVKIKRKRRGA